MSTRQIIFRLHAVQRMFERKISPGNVRQILESGELIEDYSDDMPAPGGLMLGKRGNHPIHVVMTENSKNDEIIVITAYEPAPGKWKPGFRDRKE